VSSDKLQWHQEFVARATVGEERTEYRIIPVPAEAGGAIVFQTIVKDEQSGATLLGQPAERIEKAFARCDEDIDRRRGEYRDRTIEDRTARFLRESGIRITIAAEQGRGSHELRPVGAEVLGELTRHKATLEGANRKIEFPMWGEEMPNETVALVVAKEAATGLPKFEKFCADQNLEPRSAAAKALWKQLQEFRREAGSFFTVAERQQLDRLAEPLAPER